VAGIGNAAEERDLVPIIKLVVDDFWRQLDRDIELVLDMDPRAKLLRTVDIDAFAIVLRNLIDNAMTHGDRRSAVSVRLDTSGAITVSNHGPTVAEGELAGLTERFRRARTGGNGSGLGLAICDMLVRRMDGQLLLQSPAPGQPDGFAATVRL
jgi:two-component system OmpR family sensor kinase